MVQNALFHSGGAETAGERGVGDVHEQQQFLQVLLATTKPVKKSIRCSLLQTFLISVPFCCVCHGSIWIIIFCWEIFGRKILYS